MKIRKDVNVIITFDDKEYSEEETAILYQQFFECLAKIKGVKIPEYFSKNQRSKNSGICRKGFCQST